MLPKAGIFPQIAESIAPDWRVDVGRQISLKKQVPGRRG
jgi:hypothetical protein